MGEEGISVNIYEEFAEFYREELTSVALLRVGTVVIVTKDPYEV